MQSFFNFSKKIFSNIIRLDTTGVLLMLIVLRSGCKVVSFKADTLSGGGGQKVKNAFQKIHILKAAACDLLYY